MVPRIANTLRLGLLTFGGGCLVHTYQPMSGLHRPVVVDPTAPNFQGVRIDVLCVPKDMLNPAAASALCQKVATLFENQGASVTTRVGADDGFDDKGAPAPDLSLELRTRLVHEATHPWSWAAMVVSFSLVPGVTEFTFEQELTVRDGSGFLLATDQLVGRVTHFFGFGVWGGNKLLDVTVREKPDEVIGDHAWRDMSDDLYRQLSQTTFNAHVQAQVLRAARAEAP